MNNQFPDKTKHELVGTTQTLGLDYNVAALICYLPVPMFSLIAGIVWLMTEPKANLFVRFHAIQSLMLLGVLVVGNVAVYIVGLLSAIPVLGGIFAIISGLAWFGICAVWFIVSVVLMLKANQREMYKLPIIGDLAEQYAK
ncbi:DUF4870 domain-containing protein [Candidatus Obscuribacterales bacterium]|jgi:uncharacterized membrane protein|nr:DUF4870 domain-containing protein [Candidatus Obscuribacterales bacterium]MBX3134789.1 DUF4870 domain-containing protein [Candidatus Obscuribacterales bacterium]MBX3149564.1 DUF4870 domain-containing protein [Candidatus Obscuribacterales bacterium]